MLTNNKKRSFVKLIALTLAALMVFSVCLTGCTDEDARLAADAAKDAADKAQSTADAAQTAADGKTTAEAVAAQITEALKPYLKADAALSEADVDKKVADLKATIEASLKNYQAKGDYAAKADVDKKQDKGNYATKDDLKGYQSKGDYATKGDLAGYQTKGDYATKEDLKALSGFASSEELAQLTAALDEFTEAALTKDAIAEIVTEALADYATTVYVDEAIAAAVAEEREITAADIKKAIDEALAPYMTAEQIEDRLEEMNKALTEKIESYFIGFEPEQVVELLKNVDKAMNKDEWAQATVLVTETLKETAALFQRVHDNSYTQDRKEQINTIMANINGIPTHVVVFETITNKGGSYLDDFHYDNMHEYDTNNDGVKEYHNDIDARVASAKILTDLTVFILRAATVDEINGILTAVKNAKAVPSFVEDITTWRNDLYTLGEVVPVMVNKDNELRPTSNFDFTKAATWKQATGLNDNLSMKYHNETVSSGATAKAQVVKAAHAGAYAQAVAKLEKLIVEYTLESMRFGTSTDSVNFGAFNQGAVMALYQVLKADGTHDHWEWVTPGTYKGEKWLDMEVSALTGTETAVPGGWNFKGIFAGIDTSAIPSGAGNGGLVARNWAYTNNTNAGLVMKGYQDNKYLDPMIKVDLINGYAAGSHKLIDLLNKYTPEVTGDGTAHATAKLAETYDALNQMIKDAQEANNKANDAFTGIPGKNSGTAADSNAAHDDPNQVANAPHFLWHIGHTYSKNHKTSDGKYVCNCDLWKDNQAYVNALKDYMVEWTEDEAHAPVPDSWEKPFWLSPVYTVRGLVAPWNYNGANKEQAKTLDVYFNYALNINGEDSNAKSYDGITRYDLYLELVDKAWELLYEKYKSYAAQILLTMRNDFRVAAMTAVRTTESNYTDAALVAAAAKALDLDNTANSDVAQKWTPDFVKEYWAGKDAWKWEIGKTVKKQIGPDHKMEGLDHYYYYNNIKAKHAYANSANGVKFDFGSNAKTGDTYIISDVLSALKASQQYIDIELDSVTYGPRMEILVDAENFKNSGMSEFAYKKAQGGRVQDAFDEELAVAMGNFNEIMFRYMLPEINDHYITKAYAAITGLANENVVNTAADDIYAGGIATYFSKNPGNVADTVIADKMTRFMQVYVTGHANIDNDAVKDMSQGYRLWTAGDPVQYKFQQLPEVAYANGTNMTVKVVPSSVYDALFANVNTDFAVGTEISRAATEKVEAAKGIYNNAINTMANMAVNYRFNDYIQQAKDALYFSFLSYTAVAQNYTVRLALDERYNEAVNALTITEYYANRGGIEAMDYLNAYVTRVLGVAIANDSPYYGLIAKDTSYEKQLVTYVPSASAFINKTDDKIDDAWDLRTAVVPMPVSQITASTDGVTPPSYVKSAAYLMLNKIKGMVNAKWVANKDWNEKDGIKDVANVDNDKNTVIDVNDSETKAGALLFTYPLSPMGAYFQDRNYFATGSAAVDFDKAVNVNSVADDGTQLYAH